MPDSEGPGGRSEQLLTVGGCVKGGGGLGEQTQAGKRPGRSTQAQLILPPAPPGPRKGKAAQTGKWSASDGHPAETAPAKQEVVDPSQPPPGPGLSSHLGNGSPESPCWGVYSGTSECFVLRNQAWRPGLCGLRGAAAPGLLLAVPLPGMNLGHFFPV